MFISSANQRPLSNLPGWVRIDRRLRARGDICRSGYSWYTNRDWQRSYLLSMRPLESLQHGSGVHSLHLHVRPHKLFWWRLHTYRGHCAFSIPRAVYRSNRNGFTVLQLFCWRILCPCAGICKWDLGKYTWFFSSAVDILPLSFIFSPSFCVHRAMFTLSAVLSWILHK